jgi:hypothetical protein
MFKYTPKKSIVRELDVPKVGRWFDTEFLKRQEILKRYRIDQAYHMTVFLKTHYPKVCFYSPNPVRHVPVNGFLFPVAMFNEEIV